MAGWPPPGRAARLAVALLGPALASAAGEGCWDMCRDFRMYCPEFCCQPPNGAGNPTCWDEAGYFSYGSCCGDLPPLAEPAEPPHAQLGSVSLELYRGPSDHNSPRWNERTLEVALGLWFMRRQMRRHVEEGGALRDSLSGGLPIEIGNVLGNYWPPEDRIHGRYLPWSVADVADNGIDASTLDFRGESVLSISTFEHVGYDNEGAAHAQGFRLNTSLPSLATWVAAWDDSPRLLERLASEAREFLVTFPVGFNPRLDGVVAAPGKLRSLARVLRRADAENLRWEVDPERSFSYHYDFRDTFSPEFSNAFFHERLPDIYRQAFGAEMLPRLFHPRHPRFRFANAICVVTNVPELLA